MALILPRCRILHVPKTGCTWVRQAVLAACPQAQDILFRGTGHTSRDETPGQELFTIAFVRHPLTWWRSFWLFHKNPARSYIVSHEICKACWSDDFVTFMWNVVERFPGACYACAEPFVGPPEREIDFIGHQEFLADDLVTALQLAGEPFDERLLRGTPPTNVGDRNEVASYTPELAEAVMAVEARHCERFGYGSRQVAPLRRCLGSR